MDFLTASVGESVRRDQRISGLAIPLPPPGEINAAGIQEALVAVQEVASILASSGNPFPDSTSSSSLDGESTSKAMMFYPAIG